MKVKKVQDRNDPIYQFVSGGGEMGLRIREYDWAATGLGPISSWPQSLRTCIRIMLASRQPIWIGWGKDLIKFYNDPYKAIVGGKHPWALGAPASVVWKDIWRDIEPMLRKVMDNDEGTYVESQLLIMERNGYPEETYYTFSYTPIPGDDGGTAGMICANTDDTDRIISERQLKTLIKLGEALTDTRSDAEVITNTISAIKENAQDFPFALFYTISGDTVTLSDSTDLGDTSAAVPQVIDLNVDNEVTSLLRNVISGRQLQVFDDLQKKIGIMPKGAWEIPPDKAIIMPIAQASALQPYGILVVGMNPYRLLDEKYVSFFGLVTDQIAISFANVHAIEEERKRASSLAALDLAKTTFFSNISHEFRTPLTLLLGPIEDVLNDNNTLPENKAKMDVAYRNALRMQKLVNTLLEFSRIEAGRIQGSFHPVNIGVLTEYLAGTFRSAIEKAGMHLVVISDPVHERVYADAEMWEKIVLNLVSNAFKYSNEGTIEVRVQPVDGAVKLTVRDTGVGIPADQLDKIFDRFHRVERVNGRSQEGTGIGLALVKELVKIHNGTIEVESALGVGSVFSVIIPTGKAHLPEDKVHDHPVETAASLYSKAYVEEAEKWNTFDGDEINDQTNNGNASSGKPKVLLAEDNSDMRQYIRQLLSDQFDVITANNGEDAFVKALEIMPDLILTDVMMPRLDGFGFLKMVRGNAQLKNTPVIFLSARAGEEAKVEGIEAGADDYLVKPFSARELVARVETNIKINTARLMAERELYSFLMQAPFGILILTGEDSVVELANDLYLSMVHKERDMVVGRRIVDALPETSTQGFRQVHDHIMSTGDSVSLVEREVVLFVEGTPEVFCLDIVYRPLKRPNGVVDKIMVVVSDVTEKVNARRRIEESEIRFRTLTETLPQLVWTTDKDGAQSYVSSRWYEYTGIEDIEPGSWKEILHPDDAQAITEAWEASLKNGTFYKEEVRLRNKDGQYRWFAVHGEPIHDENGAVSKWIGAFTDIHDQKDIEEKLEKLVAERTLALERSNADLQQFAHVASHDLKEPLRKVKIFIDRIEYDEGTSLSENSRTYMKKVHAATDRMFSMIDGVLTYSTINASTRTVRPVDLNDVMAHILIDLEVLVAQKDATITYTDLPTIEAADILIYQLFYNLIINSLKFSRIDVIPVIVIASSIITHNGVPYARILITDNGIGFDPNESQQIFDTFTRLNSKDKYEGTGLGLSLCKKIVERHSGTIEATGKQGQGATFTIMLPLAQKGSSI